MTAQPSSALPQALQAPQAAAIRGQRRRVAPACWTGLAALWLATSLGAQTIQCHVTFAGASRTFSVPPTGHTDEVRPLLEGASFVLEVINRLPPEPGAGVKVRTYGVFSGEPYLLHQALFLPNASASSLHGFTGLQVIREPLRHQELAYWCERASAR